MSQHAAGDVACLLGCDGDEEVALVDASLAESADGCRRDIERHEVEVAGIEQTCSLLRTLVDEDDVLVFA